MSSDDLSDGRLTAPRDAPVGGQDHIVAAPDASLTVPVSALLFNDRDPDAGAHLGVASVTDARALDRAVDEADDVLDVGARRRILLAELRDDGTQHQRDTREVLAQAIVTEGLKDAEFAAAEPSA